MMLKSGCKVFLYLVAFLCAGAAAAQATPLVAQTVSTQGFIKGQAVLVEVLVAAPAGTDAQTLNATATAAARKEGVEVSDDFTTLFGVWPQFFDKTGKNNATTLFYNPSSDPVSGALSAFRADLVAWSSVADSTFRYAFGGLTTRTPTVGDGFNDVAFVRTSGNCDFGCALGTTTSLFNIKTGVLLEADIKLYVYSGMPSMWSTNPSVPGTFDIGTVLLHELGHLAGLGHNTDPASLMYPYLGLSEVKELGAAENSALAFLYHPHPTSLASTSKPSDKHNFNLIAALDSPAPGGGTYVDHFELGSRGVNKNGVKFKARRRKR